MTMKWIERVAEIGRNVMGLICPDVCTVCGRTLIKGEKILCLNCLVEIPLTQLQGGGLNELHERVLSTEYFVGRAAAMMWYYRESPYARLIHDAKYNHRPRIARHLATIYAQSLLRQGFFDGIDIILPVPLHFTKLISRGYNQAEVIARAISEVVGIDMGANLVCSRRHATQTRKGIRARYENALNSYSIVRPRELDGKHILIVDDVITTGATFRACLKLIVSHCHNTRLSILSLAAAQLQ